MKKSELIFFGGHTELPLDRFIENVLYNKHQGYYVKKKPFGKKGDFITSPGISFLFSEMLSLWIFSLWEHLNQPKNFNIVELGPGNGELCRVLIKTAKKFPVFYDSLNIFLYEKSKSLKLLQKRNINEKKLTWINDFSKIKKGPTIFLGNEFFDSIPIKQFVKINQKIYEKFVIIKKKKITFSLKKVSKKKVEELNKFNLLKNFSFIEYPKLGIRELEKIIKSIKRLSGGIILIDYGFLKQENTDTIQSVKNHKNNNLFENIGEADITSLVNFSLLRNVLLSKNLMVNNVVSQSFFLKKMGILKRAEILSQTMNFKEKSDLYYRLERLLSSKYMGELFKVICAFKIKKNFLLGFK